MSNITALSDYTPRKLAPEPWGDRLARAREDAGHTLRTVAAKLGGVQNLSRGTIGRLEALNSEPTEARDRRRAMTLVVFYGFDPSDFGLTDDDVPPVLDLRALRDLGIDASGWFSRTPAFAA